MNAKKIYLLKLVDSNLENYENYSHPIFEELCLILNSDDLNYIEVCDDDNIFLNLLDYKVDEIVNLFEKYFKVVKEDITNNIIKGKLYPNIDYNLFKKFRIENTSIDDILDKICEKGMISLDVIDMIILKSQRLPILVAFVILK